MTKMRFYSAEVSKVYASAAEFENRVLGAVGVLRGKGIQDVKRFSLLRRGQVGRTHTGYLIFARVAGEI